MESHPFTRRAALEPIVLAALTQLERGTARGQRDRVLGQNGQHDSSLDLGDEAANAVCRRDKRRLQMWHGTTDTSPSLFLFRLGPIAFQPPERRAGSWGLGVRAWGWRQHGHDDGEPEKQCQIKCSVFQSSHD